MTPAEARERARSFEATGRIEDAARALVLGGLAEEAALLLSAKGRHGEAGKTFAQMRRFEDAAKEYEQAGMPAEAALCWRQLGNADRFLAAAARIPPADPRFRSAAPDVVTLANRLDRLSFELDGFIGAFVSVPPASAAELESYYLAAGLYHRHGFPENARDALAKIALVDPGYRDVAARLATMDAELRGGDDAFAAILQQEERFGGARPSAKAPKKPATEPAAPAPAAAAPPSSGGTLFEIKAPSVIVNPVPAPSYVGPGGVVAKRYRIEQRIGRGGMAEVFRATDQDIGEEIAIKVFPPAEPDEKNLEERFKQELRLARRITHPNVIRIFDIGLFDGRQYITMELLRGKDLEALLRAGSVMVDRALKILLESCAGLQAAHALGIVHRDVKPENLFVTDDGPTKVMDFGLAKGDKPTGITRTGMLAGTPAFMAPEQIDDFNKVTPATDVYALGAVAYRIFAGQPPFVAELYKLLMMHATAKPVPLRERAPQVSPELEAVVMRCLEKDPAARYPDAGSLGAAFAALAH